MFRRPVWISRTPSIYRKTIDHTGAVIADVHRFCFGGSFVGAQIS